MDRNFLRAKLLPLLSSRWPGYRQTVVRASAHMAAASKALTEQLGVPETVRSVMGDPGLVLSQLHKEPGEVVATRLRAWLRARGCQAPNHAALAEFVRQLRVAHIDTNPRLVFGSCCLQRYRDAVYLITNIIAPPPAASLDLTPGTGCAVPGVGTVSLQRAAGDGLRLTPGDRLTISWRQGGERCHLPGRGGSRSLKKLLQQWDVPPWWRDRVPLLYLEGELLAVGGLAYSASSRWRAAAQEDEQLWSLSWERPVSARSD